MKVLLYASALVASAPSASDSFAIACSGDTLHTSVRDGVVKHQTFELPDQTFVISESTGTVLRAMPLRSEFETVCDIGSKGQMLEFSEGTTRAYGEGDPDWDTTTSCEFIFDKSNGSATMTARFEFSSSRRSEGVWRMNCSAAAVPVFDPNGQ